MWKWFDGWQPLPFLEETRIGPEQHLDDTVRRILEDSRSLDETACLRVREPSFSGTSTLAVALASRTV